MWTNHFDELKEFDDGRIEKVVTAAVTHQGVHDRRKEIALDDVAIVELVFQSNDLSHESKWVCNAKLNSSLMIQAILLDRPTVSSEPTRYSIKATNIKSVSLGECRKGICLMIVMS